MSVKKGFLLVALLLTAVFLLGCSTDRFIVRKNGRAYYFASKSKGLYKMLCASGDFKRVLESSMVPPDMKKDLYRYNCVEPSADKVQALYVSLTPEQRKSIRSAFIAQGYEINYFPCG
ncbi:MAG: hypothetical protein M0Z48_06460 [Nitrospiraceae bacterium]|nr:hypothetical protein [Nitrospiraceae bacterium]